MSLRVNISLVEYALDKETILEALLLLGQLYVCFFGHVDSDVSLVGKVSKLNYFCVFPWATSVLAGAYTTSSFDHCLLEFNTSFY